MVATAPFAALLVAVGVDRLSSWVVERRRVPGRTAPAPGGLRRASAVGAAALLTIAVVATWSTRTVTVSVTREPGAAHVNAVAGAEEMALWRRAATEMGQDAVVLGDPANGSAYMQAVGQTPVAFAQVNRRDVDIDGNYLRDHFSSIATDPTVCEIVEHYGITHFYADGDGLYDGELRSDREPGLYGVDNADGLTLVDSGGGAALYRLTACEATEDRDFFDLPWRWDRTEPVADVP
jgi:hypothetical protein